MKALLLGLCLVGMSPAMAATPLGLPPVPVPKDNPQTPAKIALGEKLFNDKRFSADGTVACANCHMPDKAFTDSPLPVSEGIQKRKGTRNAPTVINAAYFTSQFWDGREPSLERQSTQPFLNPVEMALKSHDPILQVVRQDPEYVKAFKEVFNKSGKQITMTEVSKAIASFERTVIAGDSPFDRYYFGGDKAAMSEAAVRGFNVFLNQGRCVSCHTISQTHALFTDNRFHNLNAGFARLGDDVRNFAIAFTDAKQKGTDVDAAVLTNPKTSELGRFAVTSQFEDLGSFKTSTLRNIAVTAPYMHDGSLETLADVVDFYNNGGRVKETDPVNPFQSGGIRPLDLSDQQKKDLVAFLEALTSPQFAKK